MSSPSLNQIIREVVNDVGDPLMSHITGFVTLQGWGSEEVRKEVLAMVDRGELRMKDDDIDHDWTYRKGRNW